MVALIVAYSIILACSDKKVTTESPQNDEEETAKSNVGELLDLRPKVKEIITVDYDTTRWVEIKDNEFFTLNIRYASQNNFMKQSIYDCPRCFLDIRTAEMLKDVSTEFKKYSYSIVLFDCYRPLPFQEKLWNLMPYATYVTPPSKGSMHNRGSALDVSLLKTDGSSVDMGTHYDHFGRKAHYDYTELDSSIIANRQLLRSTMEKYGFRGIRTEWWHFSNQESPADLSDWLWPCD